jgi:hypothetical protein
MLRQPAALDATLLIVLSICPEAVPASTRPYDSATMPIEIDWSKCPDAESVPGRLSAAWVVTERLVSRLFHRKIKN